MLRGREWFPIERPQNSRFNRPLDRRFWLHEAMTPMHHLAAPLLGGLALRESRTVALPVDAADLGALQRQVVHQALLIKDEPDDMLAHQPADLLGVHDNATMA